MGAMSEQCAAYWQAYLSTTPDAEPRALRFYEAMRIGESDEDAEIGAQLILAGAKTTTSSLLWYYETKGEPPPFVGALCVVENGRSEPVCVVETTWVQALPFNQVTDTAFIVDYAEWGETAESWQERAWAYYAPHCRELGREPDPEMPLLCERFQVVFR